MNTTIQIRIDRATKTKAQKAFRNMGLDLSSGVKYLLARELNPENITYVCDYGYLHKYTPEMLKKFKKEAQWAVKHGKGYASAKEMHDDIMKR